MTLATSRRELERWLATAAFTRTTDSDCASSAKANARSTCRFATSSSARGAPSAGRFSWRPRTWRSGSPSSPAAAPRRRGSPWCSLPLEADDRRVQRLGRTHRIEVLAKKRDLPGPGSKEHDILRSEEHTSELQSLAYLVCRLLLEKKKHNIEQPGQQRQLTPDTLCS